MYLRQSEKDLMIAALSAVQALIDTSKIITNDESIEIIIKRLRKCEETVQHPELEKPVDGSREN